MTNETKQTFTSDEFFAQIGQFRQLMTDPAFMEKPEEMKDVAIQALTFVYLNVKGTKDDIESCQSMLQATLTEYAMRNSYAVTRKLREAMNCLTKV